MSNKNNNRKKYSEEKSILYSIKGPTSSSWEEEMQKSIPLKHRAQTSNFLSKKRILSKKIINSYHKKQEISVRDIAIDLMKLPDNLSRLSKEEFNRKTLHAREYTQNSIDLHGQSLDEAAENMVKFLFSLFLSEQRTLLIITGKGNNKHDQNIKKLTNEILSSSPYNRIIAYFQDAPNNLGGDGATQVYLRSKKKMMLKYLKR